MHTVGLQRDGVGIYDAIGHIHIYKVYKSGLTRRGSECHINIWTTRVLKITLPGKHEKLQQGFAPVVFIE